MPIVKHPNFGDIEIPFDEDTIVKLQREGYEVRPDPVASDKRKEIESDLVAERQRKVWKNKLLHTPQTLKRSPGRLPRVPAIPDNPEVSEQLINQWDFPYPSQTAAPAGIRQVIPNPTVDFKQFNVDKRDLNQNPPGLPRFRVTKILPPATNIKLSAVPAPAPITLNDLAAAMLVNRTNPLST